MGLRCSNKYCAVINRAGCLYMNRRRQFSSTTACQQLNTSQMRSISTNIMLCKYHSSPNNKFLSLCVSCRSLRVRRADFHCYFNCVFQQLPPPERKESGSLMQHEEKICGFWLSLVTLLQSKRRQTDSSQEQRPPGLWLKTRFNQQNIN